MIRVEALREKKPEISETIQQGKMGEGDKRKKVTKGMVNRRKR